MRLATKLDLLARQERDTELIDASMRLMATRHSDFTILLRRLADFDSRLDAADRPLCDLFRDRAAFDAWSARYAARKRAQDDADVGGRHMRSVNPPMMLCNHMAGAAVRRSGTNNFTEIDWPLRASAHLFDDPAQPPAQDDVDAAFLPKWAQWIEVSCSS